MSTPNTSLVKWVKDRDELHKGATFANIAYPEEAVPVIPLTDLTELVEGLMKERWCSNTVYNGALDDLMAQIKAHRKDGADGQ